MKGKIENFSHVAEITGFSLTGKIKPEDSPVEADIELDVRANDGGTLRLKCFSYEAEPDNLHTGKLRTGDNVKIKFHLLNAAEVLKLDKKEKSITPDVSVYKKFPNATPHYMASGEILLIEPHPDEEMVMHEKRIILDCGIYVTTGIRVNSDLKVGDYIRTSGRLDGFVREKIK